MMEVSGVVQFKVTRWLAVGTGLGQRFLLVGDKGVRKALGGPVTIFQVKVMFGVLWKMMTKKTYKLDDDWELDKLRKVTPYVNP